MGVKIIKRKQAIIAVFFLFIVILFLIVRAPYREIKIYAIKSLAKQAGVEISLTDSKLILPLGIELKNLMIRADTPEVKFASPRIDKLSLQFKLASIFSSTRSAKFKIVSGGTGKGNLIFDNESFTLQLDAANIDIAGLQYGDQFKVRRGEISINGDIYINRNILTGNASVTASGKSLLLEGTSPFLPEILIDKFNLFADKKNEKIDARVIEVSAEGIKLNGKGNIILNGQLPRSNINVNAKVDIKNGGKGAFGSYLPFVKAFSIGGRDINVKLYGNIAAPQILVNGKKVM